ncbi:MAG TPA: transporter substrate-binding domain-containing protein [Solirubrobacteraceae bacterium]|nr:transporter substrate-binding domain-containing protein [Solirubrobacteraceae bacterium]
MTAAPPPSRIAVWLIFACATVVFGGCAWIVDDDAHNGPRRPPPAPPDSAPSRQTPPCGETSSRRLARSRLPRPGHMPAGTFMRAIQHRGHLEVGVDTNFHGLGFVDSDTAQHMGLDIDVAREIARAIFGTLRIHYTPITTQQLQSAIVNKEVDIVASAFSIMCAPPRRVVFSSAYYRAQQKLLVRKDSNVRGLSDLRGEHVCATRDSTWLARLGQERGVKPYPVEERTDCVVALEQGDVAAITSDDAILLSLMRESPTMIVGPCIGVDRYAMAIDKAHRTFLRFVDAVLRRLRHDGTVAQLRRRWLTGLPPTTAAEIAGCDRHAPRVP